MFVKNEQLSLKCHIQAIIIIAVENDGVEMYLILRTQICLEVPSLKEECLYS